jgi:hypothetical protein
MKKLKLMILFIKLSFKMFLECILYYEFFKFNLLFNINNLNI